MRNRPNMRNMIPLGIGMLEGMGEEGSKKGKDCEISEIVRLSSVWTLQLRTYSEQMKTFQSKNTFQMSNSIGIPEAFSTQQIFVALKSDKCPLFQHFRTEG